MTSSSLFCASIKAFTASRASCASSVFFVALPSWAFLLPVAVGSPWRQVPDHLFRPAIMPIHSQACSSLDTMQAAYPDRGIASGGRSIRMPGDWNGIFEPAIRKYIAFQGNAPTGRVDGDLNGLHRFTAPHIAVPTLEKILIKFPVHRKETRNPKIPSDARSEER